MLIRPAAPLRFELTVPGDKSMAHRAAIMGAIAEGSTRIQNFPFNHDCLSTLDCLRKLGVPIEVDGDNVLVHGVGLYGLKPPQEKLDCGNSGTTARLLAGLLAGQSFGSILTGDPSLRRRPMDRVAEPLSRMGARVELANNGTLPLRVFGSKLTGTVCKLPVASAQLKSALLLAGLYAEGTTTVWEPHLSRDHTELMLARMGVKLDQTSEGISLTGGQTLTGQEFVLPGDFSSAAYFIVAALIVPGADICLRRVGLNPTRTGLLTALLHMGADIEIINRSGSDEPVGDLIVRASRLRGVTVSGAETLRLIDEVPVFAVAAATAEGETVVQGAGELRYKESDRIAAVCEQLGQAGVNIRPTDDGMVIRGGAPIRAARFDPQGDHRVAMACAILSLVADGASFLQNAGIIDVSFPGFTSLLGQLTQT